jgi:hypothetical protein
VIYQKRTNLKAKTIQCAIALMALAAASTVALAQTSTPAAAQPPAAQPSAVEDFLTESKKPTDWLRLGADIRLRNEYLNNGITLNAEATNHEQDYFRFRERIWASISPGANLSLNARLSGEQRVWMRPSYSSQFGVGEYGLEERYGIIDNLYVKWDQILGQPLSISVGRQDILLGDMLNWWLMADGTPGDGSWTFFLDSIRLGYDAKNIKTKFDVIYIYQNAMPDQWLPTIGSSRTNRPPNSAVDKPYYLTEQNEQGAILYVSNKSIQNTQIDAYFFYKGDTPESAILSPYGTPLGDEADIYTIGGKVTGTLVEHWKYSLEGAYQFGNKRDPTVRTPVNLSSTSRDISAFGVNGKLSYLVKDKLNNQAHLIFEFLSGDDPSTEKDEMFDVLWGRWPRWSELYIYSYIYETGTKIAQLNNIGRIGLGWSIDPIKNMNFSATYNALFSEEKVPTRALVSQLPQFSQDGNFRGHYLQTVLRHKFNNHISGHLWGEFLWMGDYYTQRDTMTFLRAEILLSW